MMASELTSEDLDFIARREADFWAKKHGTPRDKSRSVTWFLFVHDSGASLRAFWYDKNGEGYSVGVALPTKD